MHAKTDSEDTSFAPSSPARPSQFYYVQSPSRDSHDGDHKTTTSFHSTPILSSMGSPALHSSLAHHYRDSSTSTRFSASLKPSTTGSQKISPNDITSDKDKKPWKECAVIQEEGLIEEQDSSNGLPKRCYFLVFLIAFFLLFFLFSLILWGVSKSQKPEIAMKSLKFDSFTVQAGSDSTGVATDMISLNSTVKLTFRNTGTFFSVHVTSIPIDLSFNQITIASGSIKEFHQSRKSQRSVVISVIGNKIPLYGSGMTLSPTLGTTTGLKVAMKLSLVVKSRGYVFGKLVKPKFYKNIECSISFDPNKQNVVIHLKNSCTYD
ncbi:uncharacterized protein LOC124932256 [Impatiens glandulifera]|uniref:uncharacterized protein LOC124932256 n=1 Tax=Impatiens glandulifera TaxID=253017 RepID=UPI001FB16B97|nr:uncharacterized protein LOC124932256 [Impatiens glandulifera]